MQRGWGKFAWAIFEPAPGKFEFAWMDKAIEIASRHGVEVILATPTASVPPWLYEAHPDVLTGNDLGLYTYGGRKGYCTSSQNYLDACARVNLQHSPSIMATTRELSAGNSTMSQAFHSRVMIRFRKRRFRSGLKSGTERLIS